MGLRFESNYNRVTGVASYVISNPDMPWWRAHEWTVDTGYTSTLLGAMVNVEPQFPLPATVNYGRFRLMASVVSGVMRWEPVWEQQMQGAAATNKCFTPRLVIIPIGSGIEFSAGQGLMTIFQSPVAAAYRWWSCYVLDTRPV